MELIKKVLTEAFEYHKAGQLDKAEPLYNSLLNVAINDPQLLYLLGDLYCRRGWNGLAISLFQRALQIDSTRQEVWVDLGVALKAEHQNEAAKRAWERAAEFGENIEICTNMATLYADTGDPENALVWLNKALAIDPNYSAALWNSALALLAMRRWDEGWKRYEHRKSLPHWDNRNEIDLPQWDGKAKGTVYIHGEQGLGDEIMFLSCLEDVLATGVTPVLEVNEKLVGLVKATWPNLEVYSSKEDFLASGIEADYKIGLGSLPGLYRTSEKFFPGKAYLKPDQELVARYRGELLKLGPGPYIALAWVGGVKYTRVHERTVSLPNFAPIRALGTCVCAQYGDIAVENLHGLPILSEESRGGDLHHQAALFAACDAVVTVVQTAVHVAGAVGTPAYVLVPARPSWRYGVTGKTMPWYASVRLFRQQTDWGFTIAEVTKALEHDLGKLQEAKRRIA